MEREIPQSVLQRLGIASPRPAQREAFSALSAGRDVLVVLPTGGGKSLCYQLPAACGLSPAIVVSPLIALMKDQVDALRRRGVAAARLAGSAAPPERDRVWSQFESGELALLYVAPEALTSRRTLARLAAVAPRYLAVDEAHCISEWGESFRPAYLALGAVRRALGDPPTIALTATATPRTRRDIARRLALRDPVTILGGFDRPNLQLTAIQVASEDARRQGLARALSVNAGPTVIYAPTRRETERWAGACRRQGIAAAAYHAGLPDRERSTIQDDFLADRLSIIVATTAFGMGVDKPDVRRVLHTVPPRSLEAYYQEAGRGGRDGAPAECLL
ncbi:MAG: RecQ family ATP-dependent DNA helicase, partial [Gemmatimonadaceae bacterium]